MAERNRGMENFVQLKNVSKVYKMGEVEIRAVDGIEFSISKGEFVVIVGPSGAGKTTVLNILGEGTGAGGRRRHCKILAAQADGVQAG